LLTALLVLVASGTVRAQTKRAHIGPHIGYNTDLDDINLGAQASFPLVNRLEFYPSFDWYFRDPGSAWAVNADLKWRVAKDRPRWFYVGAGLDLMTISASGVSNTDAGLNLMAGAESLRGRIHPFVEARAIISKGSSLQFQGGINITLGHH
jgi:outer membrane protein X